MKKLAATFFALCPFLFACQQSGPPAASSSARSLKDERDRVFAKKLECARLMQHIEGSVIGPALRPQKGVMALNPIVFYSSKLNSCAYIASFVSLGREEVPPHRPFRLRTIDLIDLLTGETIESGNFDLTAPEQYGAAEQFYKDLLKRYKTE